MHVKVLIYLASAILNTFCCLNVFQAKGFPTVRVFLLHILLPSSVNSILLFLFSVLEGFTGSIVFTKLYNLVDIYVAYQYPIIGSFFHLLTSWLYTRPTIAAEVIYKQKKYFYAAQAVALIMTVIAWPGITMERLIHVPFYVERLIISLTYDIPCFNAIIMLSVTYAVSMWKILKYKRQFSTSIKCRKTRTVVIFFTPIIVFYIANIADFGSTLILDTLLVTRLVTDDQHLNLRSAIKTDFSSYYYPAQMIIYPICTVIAFPEYRNHLRFACFTKAFQRRLEKLCPTYFLRHPSTVSTIC
ncbi:hypothetical protein L596_011703 [Steinernema carpocapsae]|uniref:Uncharacterized protein n=1 Tax=Steinernema carpocapsae TaxID=34508 RepID=A0A4V6A4L0_STECR|nr:hypothetical protein L596_011703 [Steinernema carpocapsae]